MSSLTIKELKAQREAIEKRIASHVPLAHGAAVEKVRAFAAKHQMTEDDLFPGPVDPDADPYAASDHDMEPDFEKTLFPDFRFKDTFGYTFIADLKQQRDQLDVAISYEIAKIQREAIERVRAFIDEYHLTKADIYRPPMPSVSAAPLASAHAARIAPGPRLRVRSPLKEK